MFEVTGVDSIDARTGALRERLCALGGRCARM